MAAYTTIDNPELYFQTKLYTGNGSTNAITLDGDEDMQPDLVWVKGRNVAYDTNVFDSVRGATKQLYLPQNYAEDTYSGVTSFDSDGFTLGSNAGSNQNTNTFVAWCWKESATAGFDILTFEGNATDDTDISHNLSAVPHFMIVRNFDAAKAWNVYHHKNTAAPETDLLVLNTDAATTDTNDRWSDEAPTSSVFTVGDSSQLNASSETSIAYLWSEKQGFSKFGSYTGNEDVDGPFVYTGFRPAFVMVKRTSSSAQWQIEDIKRDPFNPADTSLFADSTDADTTSTGYKTDFLSNGFKLRGTADNVNDSGDTHIYMAFAESPFVSSEGVPTTAR